MQAIGENFYDFLTAGMYRFIIPIYQRSYSWKPKNCMRLYNDVARVITGVCENHYFGSITIQQVGQRILIIDGQQRLTTICLFLLALRDVMNDHHRCGDHPEIFLESYYDESEEVSVQNSINGALATANGVANLRLRAYDGSSDYLTYSYLFLHNNTEVCQNMNKTMLLNYRLFYRKIEEDLIDQRFVFPDIICALQRLLFAKVSLGRCDNPQTIFDCMNSTGLPLTAGDNIRNYLLMNITSEELRNEYFMSYWLPITRNIIPENSSNPGEDITEFIRTWLKYRYETKITKKEAYDYFKEKVDRDYPNNDNHLEILRELLEKSSFHNVITTGTGCSSLNLSANNQQTEELDGILSRLNFLGIKQYHCFSMSILSACSRGEIEICEVINIFRYLESYIFRGIICKYPANRYETIFPRLYKKLRDFHHHTSSSYLDSFASVLSFDQDIANKNILFPRDEIFTDELRKIKYLNNGSNKIIRYILDRFNYHIHTRSLNGNLRELPPINYYLENEEISIEHIFPQSPEYEWEQYLGSDFNATRVLCDTLGNLTLTGYNSDYSNKGFNLKKTCDKGFNVSELALNKPNQPNLDNFYLPVAKYQHWGSNSIERRTNELINISPSIWQCPNIDIPTNETPNTLTLKDDQTLFRKKKFRSIRIELPNDCDGAVKELTANNTSLSMVDCFTYILNTLHNSTDYNLGIICDDDEFKNKVRNFISVDDQGILQITPPPQNDKKLSILRTIFEFYEIDYTEDDPVIFYLAN